REDRETPPYSLRPSTWVGPAQRWATVTPIVLHHYPKRRDSHVEEIVREAFQSAGFPTPDELLISQVSAFPTVPHVRTMPPFTEGGDTLCRYQVHAKAWFQQPVHGPMLIGRGRFRGYGLLAPYREDLL
ncbi:MAG: type I-U CRISPR-associated protein Cas5/Cas6, partial [Bryobacterales bacterium]|nr:type I-U CRISPR-associated protein Cas5/Cas6 [Bryobacterales bacterium]